jgi:hypothetical protein
MISLVHKYCGQQSYICGNDVHRHLQAETVFGCIQQLHIVQLLILMSGPNLLKWNNMTMVPHLWNATRRSGYLKS